MYIIQPPAGDVYLSARNEMLASLSPKSISGLVLWLDANSLNNTLSNGDKVQTWTDRSSYAHVATQNTEANKPYFYKNKWNGNSIVRAISTNSHYMTIPRHSCWEVNNITIIYALISFGASTSAKLLVRPYLAGAWATPYASWAVGISYSTLEKPEAITASNATLKNAYIDSIVKYDLYNSHIIASFKYDGTANYVYKINGTARTLTYAAGAAVSGNLDYTNQTDLALFARSGYSLGEYSNVALGDMIVFNSALSDANLGVIVNYLKLKYGIYII